MKTTDTIDADTLDGVDSTGFLGANEKADDSDLLDGLNSTAFLGASAKAADSDLLDGLNSSAFVQTTDTIDADTLDGKNSSDFVERAGTGFILVQGDVTSWSSNVGSGTISTSVSAAETTFTSTSTSGNATHLIVPDLPLAAYGNRLRMAGVEICYDASVDHAIDQITYTRTSNPGGTPTLSHQTLDATDRSDDACRFYAPSDMTLFSDSTVALRVDAVWTATSANLKLGRVTFMLEPTATNATPIS